MRNQPLRNYLRMHRRRSGLSQRELGLLLGYRDSFQVSRHERSKTSPTLRTALAYELIFRVPASGIFEGMHGTVARLIEENLAALEERLQNRSAKGREARVIAQKLEWLRSRKRQ